MNTPPLAPDRSKLIVFGSRCVWWDSIDKAISIPRSAGLPGCPHCQCPLYEMPAKDWFDGIALQDKAHPGYQAMWLWSRGKCFRNSMVQESAYAEHLAGPGPDKVVALIPCNRMGCTALAVTAFKVTIPPMGAPATFPASQSMTMIMGHKVCQQHFDEDAASLVETSPELRATAEAAARSLGKVMPDWSKAVVTALPLASQEYREFEARAKRG